MAFARTGASVGGVIAMIKELKPLLWFLAFILLLYVCFQGLQAVVAIGMLK